MITEVEVNKNLIIEFKAKHKLNVREFISQSGISMTIYYKIFTKPQKIGMRHVVKLAKYMNISYEKLLENKNNESFLIEMDRKNNLEEYLKNNNVTKKEFCKEFNISIYLLEKLINKNYSTIRTNNIFQILNILDNI